MAPVHVPILKKLGQVTKPIVKIWYKLLYVIQGVKSIFNFLASADIKAFGRTCMPACVLLLIGLGLFYTQGVLLSISLLFVNKYHYFVEVCKQMLCIL